jgi:hypothetical protein
LLLALAAGASAFVPPNATAGLTQIAFEGAADVEPNGAVLFAPGSACTVSVAPLSAVCNLVHNVTLDDVNSTTLMLTLKVNATILDANQVVVSVNLTAPAYTLSAGLFETDAASAAGSKTFAASQLASLAGVDIFGLVTKAGSFLEVIGSRPVVNMSAFQYSAAWPPSASFALGMSFTVFDRSSGSMVAQAARGIVASGYDVPAMPYYHTFPSFAWANAQPASAKRPKWVTESVGTVAYVFNISYSTLGYSENPPNPRMSGVAVALMEWNLASILWGFIYYGALRVAARRCPRSSTSSPFSSRFIRPHLSHLRFVVLFRQAFPWSCCCAAAASSWLRARAALPRSTAPSRAGSWPLPQGVSSVLPAFVVPSPKEETMPLTSRPRRTASPLVTAPSFRCPPSRLTGRPVTLLPRSRKVVIMHTRLTLTDI